MTALARAESPERKAFVEAAINSAKYWDCLTNGREELPDRPLPPLVLTMLHAYRAWVAARERGDG